MIALSPLTLDYTLQADKYIFWAHKKLNCGFIQIKMPECASCVSSAMQQCKISNIRYTYRALFTEYFCKCKGDGINFALVCNVCNESTQYKIEFGNSHLTPDKWKFMGLHIYHVYKRRIDMAVIEMAEKLKKRVRSGKIYTRAEYIYNEQSTPPFVYTMIKNSSQKNKLVNEGMSSKEAWKLSHRVLNVAYYDHVGRTFHDPNCKKSYIEHKTWDDCEFGDNDALLNGDNSFVKLSIDELSAAVNSSCSAIDLTYSTKKLDVSQRCGSINKILKHNEANLYCLICDVRYDDNISDDIIYTHFTRCLNENKGELAERVIKADTLKIYRE